MHVTNTPRVGSVLYPSMGIKICKYGFIDGGYTVYWPVGTISDLSLLFTVSASDPADAQMIDYCPSKTDASKSELINTFKIWKANYANSITLDEFFIKVLGTTTIRPLEERAF
jgi:hypothetical protein